MIEAIKNKLWSVLRDKEVSLAMVYDRHGRILWHRGRDVVGRNIAAATGFSKSLIRQTITEGSEVQSEDVVVTSSGDGLPLSARTLFIRSLLILPVGAGFFLYLDSGSKTGFSASDHEVFRAMAELLTETIAVLRRRGSDVGGIAGDSPAVAKLRDLLISYAVEEEPVLLTGETGVGKNHIAELIHRASGRAGKMVVVHTPSIPENLFESEMFGHRRGAFTGAGDNRDGLVKEAEGGTLLLDEVSEVPPSFQAKLLSLVETRRYRLLGDSREHEADIRILAASNRDLAQERQQGRFRSDLYYRLNVLPIEIPPLRDRIEDLIPLVEQHLDLLRGKRPGPGFYSVLQRHHWPGNVRELIQVLKRAGIKLVGPELGSEVAELLDPSDSPDDALADIDRGIRAGASFWDTAWRRFLDRDLNRGQLSGLLRRWYLESGGSLRRLSEALNIDSGDYPRFVSALHKYGIHPATDKTS